MAMDQIISTFAQESRRTLVEGSGIQMSSSIH